MRRLLLLPILLAAASLPAAPISLLNASFDVTREFYADFNAAFARHWKAAKGAELRIDQSHAGSSKQARAVVDGLPADVVTMNQDTDIALIAQAGLIAPDWRTRLPDNAAPASSTIVFLVRKGNPKGIKDWTDLARPGIEVIIPNPKTSGNGRYSYLAAWAAARAGGADDAAARDFVRALFANAPILPPGGRDATTAFVQREIGDALLTFECEALQIARVFSPDSFEIVTPPTSIMAETPVSVVDKVVDRRGTREVATAYLEYLWSDEGQNLFARHFYRPRSEAVVAAYSAQFPPLRLVSVDEAFGGWTEAQKHFADGGAFDAISQPTR